MGGKTLINGTLYSINGGKTLINGTLYSINGGKTQVSGTTYSISFFTPPQKGNIITMNLDGADRQYRVLKMDGNIAEVVSMWNLTTSSFSGTNNIYYNSILDDYLNKTWYNKLSSEAQNAIVTKNIIQYSYFSSSSAYDEDTHSSMANYNSKTLQNNTGNRFIYALDIEDIEMYFGGTGGSVSDKTYGTFGASDINQLFWNQIVSKKEYIRLRSADKSNDAQSWVVDGNFRYLYPYSVDTTSYGVRAAFQIDLTKIPYTISN